MTEPTHTALQSQIAGIGKQLEDVARRLDHLEKRQDELFELATMGKAGLRTLLWVGGVLATILTLGIMLYNGWHR